MSYLRRHDHADSEVTIFDGELFDEIVRIVKITSIGEDVRREDSDSSKT